MIDKRVSSIGLSCKALPHKTEPKHSKHLSDKVYKRIMNLFFKKIVFYMIRDGSKFVMPHYLGTLQLMRYNYDNMIRKFKRGELSRGRIMVDFHETKKLKARGINKVVKINCKTTGGYWWKLHWFKAFYARFSTQSLYSIKLTRPNIRPNSYNPVNPELSVVPYFRDKGWEIYAEITPKNYK